MLNIFQSIDQFCLIIYFFIFDAVAIIFSIRRSVESTSVITFITLYQYCFILQRKARNQISKILKFILFIICLVNMYIQGLNLDVSGHFMTLVIIVLKLIFNFIPKSCSKNLDNKTSLLYLLFNIDKSFPLFREENIQIFLILLKLNFVHIKRINV